MRFSQRQGFTPDIYPIQIDSINVELKNSLWSVTYDYFFRNIDSGSSWSSGRIGVIAKLSFLNFFKIPVDELPEYGFEFQSFIKRKFFSFEWYQVYDFVEWISNYGSHWNSWKDGDDEHDYCRRYQDSVNQLLQRENSGFRFVGGVISPIISSEEVTEVEVAIQKSGVFSPVSAHIKAAVALLSDRAQPDFRNAIKESISAVEATAKLVTTNPKATLGDALKALEAQTSLHSALKEGFSKLYGWSSDGDGIRHAMMLETKIGMPEARYMLVTCSAFANYLIDRTSTK